MVRAPHRGRERAASVRPGTLASASIRVQLQTVLDEHRRRVAALVVGSVASGLTESALLAVVAQSAAAMVSRTARVHIDAGPLRIEASLTWLLLAGLALVAVRFALQGVVSVVPARLAADMLARLRRELFGAFSCASWAEQARDREGMLQELLTNQAGQAANCVLNAASLVVTFVTFAVLVLSALALNALGAAMVLVASVALFGLLQPLSRLGGRFANSASRTSIDYANGINEMVRLAEETHVFGTAKAQREYSEQLNLAVRQPYFRVQLLSRLSPSIYQGIVYLLIVAALLLVNAFGGGHAASLGAVVLLLVRAGMYGQQVQAYYQAVLLSVPYLDKLREAEERYVRSTRAGGRRRLRHVSSLAFDRVGFTYDGTRPVLTDISFDVPSGAAVGIVGPSGAGKSTLVQVLLGLRSPTAGRYLVNSESVETVSPVDWHGRIAYVPQEPHLLHTTVTDNIRFFRDFDGRTVERAAKLAGIHDDIVGWKAGYETRIGPRADAISGGQRQRICLARALAGEPEILVLDEPTSALDPHSELRIQASLAAIRDRLTLFVVAHRMSTLDVCDRAMVLVGGELQAFGPAHEVNVTSEYYRSVTDIVAAR